MRFIVSFLVIFSCTFLWSQSTDKYAAPYAGFYRAEDLYAKEQFSAARSEFRLFLNEYKGSKNDPYVQKALYYEGLSALQLFNNDAIALLENFMMEYPESIYKSRISLEIGRYYYQKKDYKKSIEYFQKLKRFDLDSTDIDEYHFKLGYANFQEKQYREAKTAFFEVKESPSQYGPPALYYYSHLSYMDSSYQVALDGFTRLLNDERFKKVVPYYITQIYHMQGRYEDIVAFSHNDMDSLKPNEKLEMYHIIGDAYYRLKKYDEAVFYLSYYNDNAKTTRDDDYQLAISYSKSGECSKAIKYFDKVSRIKDTLGQIALYHAGECYLSLNELAFAKNAFEAAAALDMDDVIEEDALFQFAILSYKLDLNPYDETVLAFEKYLNKYPNSPRKNVIYQYLVNVYTTTKNYQGGLESLDRITNKDAKLKTAYQVLSFNRGVELYLNNDYKGAIAAFEQVSKYPMSEKTNAEAMFWIADSYYGWKQYDKAIQKYDAFLAMPATFSTGLRDQAIYNKGYAYLAKGTETDYTKAKECFQAYVGSTTLKDKAKKADAHMRLADEYYRVGGRKQEAGEASDVPDRQAVANYKAALDLKSGNEDRALFYMAKCYGYLQNRDEKIKSLLEIINNYTNSKYMQTAILEVAQTYFGAGNNDKAERYFKQLIADYPTSSSVKDCYHFLGEIAFKKGQYSEAEKMYKKVLDEFVNNDETCRREVEALAELYVQQKTISKIEGLSALYSCADSLSNRVEDEYYKKAYDYYVDSNFTSALQEFNFYLNKYPNGKFLIDALNFKAAILYAQKKEEEAVAIYQRLLEGPDNDYTELASLRAAKYLFNSEQYTAALPCYERLEKVAVKPEYLNSARIGQMRCHFLFENYVNSAQYADKVLETQQTADLKLEAEYIRGLSLAKSGSYAQAIPSLEYVVKNTTNIKSAEAKYTIAWVYFQQKDYTKTDAVIRELLKMKPKYDYWVAKGLILQTQLLIAQDNLFQAEKTIKSVLDYYTNKTDGILEEAGEWYDKVMSMKNQPKSIQAPDGGTVIDLQDKNGEK